MLSLLSALWLFAVFALAARAAVHRPPLARHGARARQRYEAFSSTGS